MRGRPRTFDWDEAARLLETGLSRREVAGRMGVSVTAVYFAVSPEAREQNTRRKVEWQRSGVCAVCGGRCSRTTLSDDGVRVCRRCWNVRRTKQRPEAAWCNRCEDWKPIEEFSRTPGRPYRTVRNYCRSCDTEMKRMYRAKVRAA